MSVLVDPAVGTLTETDDISLRFKWQVIRVFDWLSPGAGCGRKLWLTSMRWFLTSLSPSLSSSDMASTFRAFSRIAPCISLNSPFTVRKTVSQSLFRPLSRHRPLEVSHTQNLRRLLSTNQTTPVSIPRSPVPFLIPRRDCRLRLLRPIQSSLDGVAPFKLSEELPLSPS